jgi:hypothetical protein
VSDPQRPWLHVAHGHGHEAIAAAYAALATGQANPRDGHMLHFA